MFKLRSRADYRRALTVPGPRASPGHLSNELNSQLNDHVINVETHHHDIKKVLASKFTILIFINIFIYIVIWVSYKKIVARLRLGACNRIGVTHACDRRAARLGTRIGRAALQAAIVFI